MQTLSKEAESKLLDCIRDVAAEVAGGSHPTAAVTKVAQDAQLSPHFVRLVCQAYNTGSTTRQRESHSDVLGKMAEFAIADPAVVLAELYPSTPKQAAVEEEVDAVYGKAPAKPLNKAALSRPLPKLGLQPYAGEGPGALRLKMGAEHRQKKAAEDAKLNVLRLEREMSDALGDLGDYFKRAADARDSFHTVERNVELLFGKTGAAVMTYVRERNRLNEKSLSREKPAAFNKVNIEHQPYSYVVKIAQLGRQLIAARADAKLAAAEVAVTRPFRSADAADPIINNGNAERPAGLKQGSFLTDLAGKGFGAMGGAIGGKLAPKPTSSLLEDAWLDLEDPRHENALRQNDAQAMLTDLMANDEVISGYPPEEVFKHYNEISQLHPHAANSPILMRPQLRKALASGGLEPFETGEIAKTEQTLNKTKNLTPRSQGLLDAPNSILG